MIEQSVLIKEPRICPICGCSFLPARINQAVCSNECRYKREKELANKNRPQIEERECKVCGKAFLPGRKNEVCCSNECKIAWKLARNCKNSRIRYHKGPDYKKTEKIERLKQKIALLERQLKILTDGM